MPQKSTEAHRILTFMEIKSDVWRKTLIWLQNLLIYKISSYHNGWVMLSCKFVGFLKGSTSYSRATGKKLPCFAKKKKLKNNGAACCDKVKETLARTLKGKTGEYYKWEQPKVCLWRDSKWCSHHDAKGYKHTIYCGIPDFHRHHQRFKSATFWQNFYPV